MKNKGMHHRLICILLLTSFITFAQEDEDKKKVKALRESQNLTWEANKELSEGNFVTAEGNYRKAIHKSGENVAAPYNLGNAYYNNETYTEAFSRYKQAGELAANKTDKHSAYHNMGNVFMKSKEYEKAVNAYKEALRNNPKDEETRYNLALAKEMLKKQQDEDKKNDQNKDDKDQKDKDDKKEDKKDGDNKEDKNKGDKKEDDKKDQKDEGDKGDKKEEDNKEGEGDKKEEEKEKPNEGEGDKKKEEEKQQQPRPNQLSKQQVKNLLEAMQNEEKKVQEKIDAQRVKGAKIKNEKDW